MDIGTLYAKFGEGRFSAAARNMVLLLSHEYGRVLSSATLTLPCFRSISFGTIAKTCHRATFRLQNVLVRRDSLCRSFSCSIYTNSWRCWLLPTRLYLQRLLACWFGFSLLLCDLILLLLFTPCHSMQPAFGVWHHWWRLSTGVCLYSSTHPEEPECAACSFYSSSDPLVRRTHAQSVFWIQDGDRWSLCAAQYCRL